MAIYPKFVTVLYKDKDINIKIPVRARLILLDKYKCPQCDGTATLKDLEKWYEDRRVGFLKVKQSETDKKNEGLLLSKKAINCPLCSTEKKSIEMIPFEKKLICLYVEKRSQYVKIANILKVHLPIPNRWNDSFVYNKNKISGYVDFEKLKTIKNNLRELIKEKAKEKNNFTINYINHNLTEKSLNEAYEIYQQKKVEKSI